LFSEEEMTVPKEMNNRRTTEKDIREVIGVVAVVVLIFGIPCVPGPPAGICSV